MSPTTRKCRRRRRTSSSVIPISATGAHLAGWGATPMPQEGL
ncbi:hypothetical protein HMPREF1979_02286 [Actinomyces johnsonii F0542]|uniref:Uncharacterized protein n=1 Tax=Actinomyces johnsonii F0542 TaxID=1321818 RepID=U1QLP3_9ACTO|nr:hypothetical protein HMPREF1979_02286 [Actinomyces johnsonii F0542]